MTSELISKLSASVNGDIDSECAVVYILTRIGKILETNGYDNRYLTLRFYRNWSVHTEIENTKNVKGILQGFIDNKANRHTLSLHTDLRKELNNFLEDHEIPIISPKNMNTFIYNLGLVLTDTPIKISVNGLRYAINFSRPADRKSSGVYSITVTKIR